MQDDSVPPRSSNIQEPRPIRVNGHPKTILDRRHKIDSSKLEFGCLNPSYFSQYLKSDPIPTHILKQLELGLKLFSFQELKAWSEFKYDWSYIVAWIGVGLALIASILFSLAAVCIRTDKEREDAMNMQYLMPVYHQKQHPYGPYGYAAYPGPYYGSQYGPYNY